MLDKDVISLLSGSLFVSWWIFIFWLVYTWKEKEWGEDSSWDGYDYAMPYVFLTCLVLQIITLVWVSRLV